MKAAFIDVVHYLKLHQFLCKNSPNAQTILDQRVCKKFSLIYVNVGLLVMADVCILQRKN